MEDNWRLIWVLEENLHENVYQDREEQSSTEDSGEEQWEWCLGSSISQRSSNSSKDAHSVRWGGDVFALEREI